MIDLAEAFERHNEEEYMKFARIAAPRSKRPDLHAFLLLDELVPGASDIVTSSAHESH